MKENRLSRTASTTNKKTVSIVCPVFNEEDAIPLFFQRYLKAIESLRKKYKFRLVFTNNCSTDNSLQVINELICRHVDDVDIEVISLSRNFGYQAAVQAALTYVDTDASIVIDCDCEDPPEMIPEFIEYWQNGYEIIYGERLDRHELYIIKRARLWFYQLLRKIGDYDIVLYMAEFALIDKKVRKNILNKNNSFPFLRAEMAYVGFRRKSIPYKREKRVSGKTNYNLKGMLVFGLAGILTSSTFPLRLLAYLFPFCMIAGIASAISLVSFELAVIVFSLYLSFSVTVLSVYLARIYKNQLNRPLYVIDYENSQLLQKG